MYSIEDLGLADISLGQRNFHREDFELVNPRGQKLQCSLFAPVLRPKKLPCVIYCHGNSGCRLDAIEALKTLLPMNVMVATLDFSGCGLSEGEYISLGFYEKADVNTLVNHLRDRGIVSRIALWGRSMGAVTAIQCAQADPSLACIVVDSAFSNLQTLAVELASNTDFNIPGLMLKIAFRLVRKSVKKRAKFDIKKLDIIKFAQEAFVPALFGHGDEDDFIAPSHTISLQSAYAGDSNKVIFGGDHNSPRPPFFMSSVSIFFRNHLFVASDFGEDNPLPNKMTLEEYFSVIGGGDAMRIFAPIPRRMVQRAADGSSDYSDDEYAPISPTRGSPTDVTEDDLIQQAIALSLQDASSPRTSPHQNGSSLPPRRANGRPAPEEEEDAELAAVLALSAQEAKVAGIEVSSELKSSNGSKNGMKSSSEKEKPNKQSGSSSEDSSVATTTSPREAKKDAKKDARDKKKKEKEKKRKSSSFSPDKTDHSLSIDFASSPSSDDSTSLSARSDSSKKDKKSKSSSKDSSSKSSKASPAPPYPLTKANTIHTIDSRTVSLDTSNESDESRTLRSNLSSSPPISKKKKK